MAGPKRFNVTWTLPSWGGRKGDGDGDGEWDSDEQMTNLQIGWTSDSKKK